MLLAVVVPLTKAAPFQIVWLQIKSDKELGSFFEWTEFAGRKGSTMGSVLRERFASLPASKLSSLSSDDDGDNLRDADGKELHLYKVVEIDLKKTLEELGLNSSGERFYLTREDIMAH